VELAGGLDDVGDTGASDGEGGRGDRGRERGPADGTRLRLAGAGAERAIAIGALERHLAGDRSSVRTGRELGTHRLGLVARREHDLPSEDPLLGLVALIVGQVVRLDLGVGDVDAVDQLGLPLALAQLLRQVEPEGLVGEAAAGDDRQVLRVVRAPGDAAAHPELLDRITDLGVADALPGGFLTDQLLAHQFVDQEQLEIGAHLAVLDQVEERVRARSHHGELADRLAVDDDGRDARVASTAQAHGRREGDDHAEHECGREDPKDDEVRSTVEFHVA
jgi:hypothetical protein